MHYTATNCGEVNRSPVPMKIGSELEKTGLRIISFYENVASSLQMQAADERIFGFFGLTQLIGGDGCWHNVADNIQCRLHVGDWILVTPDFRHRYGAADRIFIEDSISFNGPIPHLLYRQGVLRNGVFRLDGERMLLPIIARLRHNTLLAQLEAHNMLIALLLQLASGGDAIQHELPDEVKKLRNLMKQLRAGKFEWHIGEMAEFCNMSESHFRKCFRREFGEPPKNVIDKLRFERAAAQLADSNASIATIARQCGFEDVYYFSRRFKQLTGDTPGACRRKKQSAAR